MTPVLRSTTVFASGDLLTVARLLAKEAQTYPLKAIAAVPMSAAAAEAYINDLGHWAKQTARLHTPEWYFAELFAYADEARRSTLARAELVSRAFKGQPPDRGATWWQDLALLFQVRDALMHRRPQTWEHEIETLPYDFTYHKVADQLIRRRIATGADPSGPLPLTEIVAQADVARWAFNSVVTMVHELMKILPPSMTFIVFTGLANLEPIREESSQ